MHAPQTPSLPTLRKFPAFAFALGTFGGESSYSSCWRNLASTEKSSRVVVSPVSAMPIATSLSNRRMIFSTACLRKRVGETDFPETRRRLLDRTLFEIEVFG